MTSPATATSEETASRSFLRKSAAAYEALVARALRLQLRGADEESLKWVGLAATAAWIAHPGRYADDRLEAVGLRVGQRLEPLEQPSSPSYSGPSAAGRSQRRVLHVATTVYETGGHTRLIENWIKNDEPSLHSLVLLDQRQEAIRPELARLIEASGGSLMVFPEGSRLLDKARRLRGIARSGYDCVILHHHPNDVVPLVALATEDCPPVAVMNHADHVFWLGASVADVVVEFRDYGTRISRDRRGTRLSLMCPLPLDLSSARPDRAEARARLGLSADEVMLLSMGSSYKYVPTDTHNFFRTLDRILTDNPKATLYVVGLSEDQFRSFGMPLHDRIRLRGLVSDPAEYKAAADLYLESFPYGSYTALIETAALGVCPVLMYAPKSHTAISGDVPLKGAITNAADEADYIARVTALINDAVARMAVGDAVARQIASFHGVDIGRTYLHPIYQRLSSTTHQFASPSPRAPAATEDDLSLAGTTRERVSGAILQQILNNAPAGTTVRDLLRILAMSIRIGDTRLTPSHVKGWLGLFRRKLFPPIRGSGAGK